jgi:hypothetical protein
MPDFDKNLKPVLKNEQDSLPRLDNPASTGRAAYVQSLAGEVNILDKFFGRGPVESPIAPTVTSKELYDNRRYGVYSADIVDIEDQKAYAQTFAEKSANGILKGLNLTATTFAGGFGMLYGLGSSAFSGRLADVWDNPGLRALDEWNTKVDQEYLPNYYTNVEKEANWYSTDNWFKANFLFDKLIKNSGYAVGAMLSGNVANAGVKVAGAAIGRAAAALESANSFKLFTPLLRNTSRAFSVGKNVEAASILEGEISSIADLSSKSSRLAEIAAETNMFGQLNSLGRRTAIAAYSSAGEASFEALQTAKEYKENLINQYVKANGYEPSGEELKSIEAEAESVGKASFFGNLAILGATEYVQLPRLLGSSYAADKQAANSLLGQVDDVALKDGKYVRVEPRTKFGRLSDKVTGVGKYVADPKEGLQEGLQYALQVGTQNYYNKAYQTDAANVWTDGLLYGLVGVKDGEGVGALTSKEGAESILLGAVTGGLMQARGNFQESRTLTDNTNRFLNILNGAPSFKDAYVDKLNSVNRAVILQQQQQQAVVQGNKLEAKDLDADLMHNYLVSRIKYGRLDMVLDEIKDLKREGISEGGLSQLKEQGLANINDTVESYQQRLDTLENTAKNTGEIYKALDLRYSGLVNREGERTYPPMVIDKMAYAAAKIADYDLRIPKMNGALADAGILTVDVLQSIIKENKANKEATDAALLQINELDVTSEIKDELKTALSDVIELSLRRKLFMQEYDDIKENPQEYLGAPGFGFGDSEEMPVTVDQEVIEKKKKKIVSKELEVGKLYSLEQPIYKQGNELVVAPKLAVVSQTLGGELEVRLPNGDISFFTPEEFKQFKISDQESPSEDIEHIMNNAIDNVLKTAKFSSIEKPTGDDKLAYINSLDNPELTDAVFEQYTKTAEGYFKKKAKDDKIKKGNASILNEQKGDPEPEKPVVEAADYNQVNRKTKLVLPRATVATPQIPGYKNSIEFGANLYKFENRKQIRGVYVTAKNEGQLGLKGLMNHLKGTSDIDANKTIAVVMVEQIGNTIKVVGVDGKTLDTPTFDTAVFQVMPDPKFQWSEKFGGKSMFPEGTTDKEKNAIIKEYTEFVNETLDSTDLSPFQVEASFGVPQRVTDSEGNEVKNARTGVVASGLIKASDLATRAVIYVPTLEDVAQKGSTYYSNARGKIFLDAGNGYVPLQNKLHSEKEANTIYQVIDRLANIKYEEGDFNSPEAKRLFNWLRSVTYWGTPKNSPGVNSVWFAESGLLDLRLNMSNDGTNFTFTPVSIEANKDAIIAKLQGMYNNVRSAYVTDELSNWNQPYEEILSVDKDGNLKTKQWKNYQSYLLSSEGRTGEETPLTVPYKEASSATSNREGIYFVNTDSKAKYAGIIEKANVAKKEILTPIAPSPTAGFVLDGQTPNTIKNADLGDIVFTVNGEELTKSGGKSGVALVADENDKLVSQPAIDKLAKSRNISVEQATQLLASSIYNKLTVPATTAATVTQTDLATGKVVSTITTSTESVTPSDEDLIRQQMNEMGDDAPFRVKVQQDTDKFEKEDWPKIEEFMKNNFPMIPLYRVKNIIRGLGGIEAWGMLKNGGIYVYENAEVGTAYHEVFEAVWKLFSSPEERTNITNEFRNRAGSFVDRMTGETVKYSEATDFQLKEQLAEEFRDFVKDGKVPMKPAKGQPFIVKLFNDIVRFIKTFFVGPQAARNTEELFKRMTTGFYSEQFPGRQQLSYARAGVIDVTDAFADRESETRLKGFVGQEVNDIMQQMTYETLQTILKEGKNIFDIGSTKTSKTELYNNLKDLLQKTALKSRKAAEALIDKAKKVSEQEGNIAAEKYAPAIEKSNSLWKRITDNWEDLVEKHQEYLMSYNITFDENDEMNIQQEKGKDETYDGAEKIDNFRKANAAVKLLLSTIPIMRNGNLVYTSIDGAKLLPTSEVYMAIINRTYAATNPDEMFKSLRQLAIDDENYRTLYKYITKQKFDDGDISYDVNNDYDVRLINSMWRLFNKQNPTVKNLYILDNGDVQVGDSNFTTAARQLADEFKNGVVSSVKNNTKYFEYSSLRKGYAPKVDKNGKAVIASEPTNTLEEQVKFLAKLGIEFNMAEVEQLDNTDKTRFSKAALGIKKSFTDLEVVSTLTGRTLSINGRLLDLATIQAKIENPEFDSVFYNVNGDATQTFIGVNALSNLHSFLSKLTNIDQLANTPYSYLLTDSFAQGSVLLGKMFDIAGDGSRIKDSQNLMESSWADGTINSSTGKKKQSNKLNYQERLIQELNMNIAGFYYNLVPGDASLEHMAYMGNAISTEALRKGYEDGGINTIFKNYFISELNLAREGRDVRKSKELRFFRSILDNYKSDLHDDIMEAEGTVEGVYEAFKDDINNAVDKYIKNKTVQFKNTLSAFEIITEDEENPNVWNLKNLSIGKTMNNNDLLNHLEMLQINFMIANIEFHKLLYSDPYQYKDELKRIKNFLSPRQSLAANSSKLNTAMNKVYNKGYKKGDVGYTDFTKDYFKTVTFADVVAIGDLPGYGSAEDEEGYKETDGSGIISLPAYRNFRIRSGDWNDAEERQYRFDIRYRAAFKAGAKPEQLIELLKQNPGVQSAYTPLKPIVSGNKANGKNYNDIVLDKFALYPSSFRVLHEMNPDSNAIKLYEKMETEEIDYVVFESGRKVGTQEKFAPYDENDQFNNAAFTEEQIVNIPFSIMATQSEVPSKEDGLVTRGSQITKLVTLDFMQAGVPIDYKGDMAAWIKLSDDAKKEASPIYKEINNNQLILEGMISLGFNNLLNSMGIKQVGEEFEVTDFSKAASTLRREVLKREVNDNISDALAGFLEGKVTLEATPAYQQIRNILYSIADREVISQKVGGGMKVQIPSTFFEEERIKSKDGKGYTSDVLKFYTNKEGQRVAEVMLARWFDIDMTDQQLLDYFNNTPEGQEILKGIGFRIPTQKQNSIDVIKIAKFLPKEFGDSVVVPSALVNKAGSDFDIDKLSVYLKNIYQNNKGEIKPIPFYGVGEKAINKLRDLNLDINIYDVYKRSLENGYFTSLENLISSEENFEPLTTPNSADQLKKLSGDIVSKLGIAKIDYADPGNMLDRRFMSRLRQAFISGKYAIGIAAVNQTNHSLNQRTNIFVDFDGMKGKLNQVDRDWLGDGKVKFKEYNTIEVNGKSYPSLSMIYNKANQRISDILSQFIDGYVDIAKGPWIIELGATPNTASTWMFLTKIGVPIDTIAYFMNQPIIRDYLRKIENAGYSWLFIDDFVKEIKTSPKYAVADNYNFSKITSIPSTTSLKETVGVTKFGNQDARAQQQFMLDEFLKYAKMASQMFTVTQGSNFDTATFNDPYLIFKKEQQLIKAQNTIIASVDKNGKIIPGVNAILENSFLGVMAKRLQDVRNAYSKILTSDNKAIRNVIEKVLSPYTDMSDADFIKIAQKAVADLFDWAVQIDKKLNREVTDILLSDGNAASEINKFINTVRKNDNHKLYDNQVVKLLEQLPSSVRGGVNNMKIKNKTNKVYDQNEVINGFRELKTYLGEDPLYDKIVKLTVLQSGLSKSPISFTSLLPHEDFENIYNKTLSTLDKMSNLEDFYKLGVFQRNNWNNDDIVPYRKAKFKQDKNDKWFYSNALNMKDQTIEDATNIGRIPQLMKLSSLARDSNKDYLVYSWEVGNKQEKAEMRKRGDYSYIKKALFKKVYDGTTPLAIKNFYGTPTYVYKQINAWGDGMKANEFYNVSRKSVIPNGFEEATEVQDDDILEYFTYDETTDSAKETATTAITTNEATELVEGKISLPRRETKKTTFTVTAEGKNYEMKGYKVIIPEYPNAEIFVSNDAITSDDNIVKSGWAVQTLGGRLVSDGRYKSIDEAIVNFQKKINNIKSTEVLKKVQEATKIFVGDPQETLTLQDGRAYTKLEIDGKLLKKLGYTPEEIGNILKEIC